MEKAGAARLAIRFWRRELTSSDDYQAVRLRRVRWEVWALVAGLSVVGVSALMVQDPPVSWETSVFEALNGLPQLGGAAFWVLQQAGSAIVLPLVALVLWRLGHGRLALGLLVGGFFFGWLAAKGLQAGVGRGRPGALFIDVEVGRGVPVTGEGFPSGHAVLAFTLAAIISPLVSTRTRWIMYSLAAVVAVTRVYVGAHLPLDVSGGAGYGTAIGSAINLVVNKKRTGDQVSGRD